MSRTLFKVLPLDAQHDRSQFLSGCDALDTYLKTRATQEIRRRVTACFVALDPERRIAGYYTLASASIRLSDLPTLIGKKLPRYPSVPAVRMGRLVVDRQCRQRGLGAALLADGLNRSIRAEIAAFAMLVDAKDEGAAAFYRHHGFITLSDTPLTLFLPLATAQRLIATD
ncbi:MAG: GNAT family N-acetyltransferase [Janthinobacterium lividum]